MGTASIAPEGGIRPEPDMGSILPPKNDTSQWVNSALSNAGCGRRRRFAPKRRLLTDPPLAAAIPRPATGSRSWRWVTGSRQAGGNLTSAAIPLHLAIRNGYFDCGKSLMLCPAMVSSASSSPSSTMR